MQLFHDSGLPPGLINLVGGDGPSVGMALVNHPGVRFISFTGSTNTGRSIAAAAGGRLVRTCLELGGKSASIVLDEQALTSAVAGTVGSCSRNTGQTCTALTRLAVPTSLVDHASELIVDHFSRLVIGDPRDESTVIGPLVSARQRNRALEIIASGEREGARRIYSTQVPDQGHFVSPTVFRDVIPSMRVAREEIFAPVLSIIAAPESELLSIANDSEYGLAASVWGTNSDQALGFAERLEAGAITVNGAAFNPSAPYGGLKQSGVGRELGRYGLEEFLEYKAFHGGAR
jgi:aldehyde dehydrogenase (NAD+)